MKVKNVGQQLMLYRVPFEKGAPLDTSPQRVATYEGGPQGISERFFITSRETSVREKAEKTESLIVDFQVLTENSRREERYWKVPVASKKAASGRTSSTTDVLGRPSYERLIESGRIDTLALDGNASRRSSRFYTKIKYDSPAGSATTRRVALCDRETGQCEPFEEVEAWPPDCRGSKQVHAEY